MAYSLDFQLDHPGYRTQRAALKSLVTKACRTALKYQKIPKAELTVLLSTDSAIQALNHHFRTKDNPTNVLAFPSGDADYLGDIMVSLDTVTREAKEQGKLFDHHLSHLIIHACLHLLGYDHMKEAEAEHMESIEISILQLLKIGNPYD